ncbi:MAG: sigma-54 dependent transcriptional regulator [bacterium]
MKKHKILIADDEAEIREMLARFLEKENYCVERAESGKKAVELISKNDFNLIISDIKMPDMGGMELLEYVKRLPRKINIVLMTGYASIENAVEALKLGAFDYIGKPPDFDRLQIIIRNALEKADLEERVENLTKQIKSDFNLGSIIGKSMPMLKVFELVSKVARSDVNVLLTGESGTGKELIAQCVHYNSRRNSNPFVAINCCAITDTLFESELFGHEKGAFTGAVERKDGYIKKADGGTMFLDEIADLPPPLQGKLIRVIQEKQFQRVGSTTPIEVDVRFVSATNRDIPKMVENGGFREDLFYRLNVITIEMPPLRHRKEDIPILTQHFVKLYAKEINKPIEGVSDSVMQTFSLYPWPGNVRELKNIVERAITVTDKNLITEEDIPRELIRKVEEGARIESPYSVVNFNEAKQQVIDKFERGFLIESLQRNNGNVKNTAEEIGMLRTALQRLLNKHNIRSSDFKKR